MDLSKLQDVADQLHTVTDQLNANIHEIEANINRLNLGVEVWLVVPVTDLSGNSDPVRFSIGYGRARKVDLGKVGWGILAKSEPKWTDKPVKVWMLSDSPRWLRSQLVDHIPALLEELDKQTKSLIGAIRTETAKAELMVSVIRAINEEERANGGYNRGNGTVQAG